MTEHTRTLIAFLVGLVVGMGGYYVMHKNYKNVIKTNIGDFIIDENKIFSVYEMERNRTGDIQVSVK